MGMTSLDREEEGYFKELEKQRKWVGNKVVCLGIVNEVCSVLKETLA